MCEAASLASSDGGKRVEMSVKVTEAGQGGEMEGVKRVVVGEGRWMVFVLLLRMPWSLLKAPLRNSGSSKLNTCFWSLAICAMRDMESKNRNVLVRMSNS